MGHEVGEPFWFFFSWHNINISEIWEKISQPQCQEKAVNVSTEWRPGSRTFLPGRSSILPPAALLLFRITQGTCEKWRFLCLIPDWNKSESLVGGAWKSPFWMFKLDFFFLFRDWDLLPYIHSTVEYISTFFSMLCH